MNWLRSFIEETPGVGSSTRLNMVLTTVTILTMWVILCISTKSFMHWTGFDVAALSIGVLGKISNDFCNK